MKVVTKIDYYCEYCDKHFKDKTECEKHEEECKESFPRIAREFAQKLNAVIKEADKYGVKFYSVSDAFGEVGSAQYDCEKGKIGLFPF